MQFTRLFHCILLFSISSISALTAQTFTVSGTIQDEQAGEGIPMATVALVQKEDSSLITGTTTDLDGGFEIVNVEKGGYFIQVKYLGYQTAYQPVSLEANVTGLTIGLLQEAQTLDQVHITAEATMSTQ